ncbi:MAG: T9SS type A sorting domain-containing protein [Bacteroidales bacterium]|nr:T9SS type A sorting domain-containing protein [Bacteroidales bacterium]
MKFKKLFVSIVALLIVGVAYLSTNRNNEDRARYDRRDMTHMVHTKGIKKAMEYLSSMKGERLTRHIDQRDVVEARNQLKSNRLASKALSLQWDELGPDNVGGRTRAICIDPNDPNTIYIGGVSGGLWKTSTGGTSWTQITDVDENLSISSIEMDLNGNIYVGTGESFANVLGNNYSTPGIVGTGVYKSSDNGASFDLLSSTIPSASNSATVAWALVNRVAVEQSSGDVWAATNKGLKYSDDGGVSWADPPLLPTGQPLLAPTYDVKVSPGGIVGAVVGTSVYISKTGSINDFNNVSTGNTGMLPNSNLSRVELAFAENDKTIYAVIANNQGALEGIYMSDDKGDSWLLVGPGGSSNFQVFGSNSQGAYDNVVAVDPANPYHIFVGGINMWEGTQIIAGQSFAWSQITQSFLDQLTSSQSDHYVHADHHVYKFHPNDPNTMYAGTDGGIFRTTNKGNTFAPLNRNYNVTQFYTLAIAPDGGVMGGTQDNSTPYVSGYGNTPMNADVLFFGDGGHAAFSTLDQEVMFVSSYYGRTGRSYDKGADWELGAEINSNGNEVPGYYSERMINSNISASFVTPLKLWESVNVTNSVDSVWFKADTTNNYSAGDTIIVRSNINRYPFKHILSQNLNAGDSVKIVDRIESRFYLGTDNAVWMTREALDFSKVPEWFKIADINGTVQSMVVSNDGDVMYVGTQGGIGTKGRIYRISNIMSGWDYATADADTSSQLIESTLIKEFSNGRWVTSIAIDPSDKDHIIVTLGNYGESQYVYRSTDATSATPTFTSRQGDLPAMPVYASLIPMFDGNSVLLGTEYGIYATDDITSSSPTWVEENTGLDRVPVYMLGQQTMNLPYMEIQEVIEGQTFTDVYPGITNYGRIYAATYGRGFFSTDKYTGIQEPPETYTERKEMHIKLYPNPVSDVANIEFELKKSSDVVLRVYDMNGRLMKTKTHVLTAGDKKVKLNIDELDRGNYILQVIYEGGKTSAKRFIVL